MWNKARLPKIYLPAFYLILAGAACTPPSAPPQVIVAPEPPATLQEGPKNIILMIGDGMGIAQISAGLYQNDNQLHLERFPIVGLHKPYSSDNLVPDSASGATAFSTGQKTYNGGVGVDEDGNPITTILEEAEKEGLSTGMVTTSTIVHATPAAFIAHVEQRNQFESIAAQFLDTEIDFFVGGGRKYFSRREDERNLLSELEEAGYFVASFEESELTAIEVDYRRNFAYFTAETDPETVQQGRRYLKPASKLACTFLNRKSTEDGFFLMIEGAQIDWGGHNQDMDYMVSEMIDFDETIGAVLDFAKGDGETLVIVTADHETGGFAINPGSAQGELIGAFTSDYHTAVLIPVFAYGPGAELFGGVYENTAIYQKMRTAWGW